VLGATLGLYGIITDFGGKDTETIVYTVQINPKTGQWIRIVKNFIYIGGSATYDGLSGYDSDNDVLYYATDFATPFLYSSDLKNQVLLPPIDMGFSFIETIDYDTVQKRLLVYGPLVNKQPALMSYSTNGGDAELMAYINQFTGLAATIVDSKNQLYYVIGTNSSQWSLGIIDLNDPSGLKASYPIQCNFSFAYSFEENCLYYDESQKKLYAIAVSTHPDLAYWLADIPIDKQGMCTAYPIQTSQFGIGTAFTYDQMSKTLWFGFAVNGPSRLISYDTQKHMITNDFEFSDIVVLEDLQVTYF